MPSASLVLDSAFTIAPVPSRLFGSFVEHMGRCVYTGIYEPDHPAADSGNAGGRVGPDPGGRADGGPISGWQLRLRLPLGGRCRSARRTSNAARPGLAHRWSPTSSACTSSSDWAAKAGTEPMMAVNLGTRGLQEACDLLEYTNHPGGTALVGPADRATAPGTRSTSGCGAWATRWTVRGRSGHKTAAEYGRLANETGKAMRLIDRDIELVACGSSNSRMPTFGAWEVDRARALLRGRWTTCRCTPTTRSPTAIRSASSLPPWTWTSSSSR